MITTDSVAHQHFSGAGSDEVIFARPVHSMYLTTSGDVSVSFDGGVNYMPVCDGTHNFLRIYVKALHFSGGTWAGVGVSL